MKKLKGTTVTLGAMENGGFLADVDEDLNEVLRKTKAVADQTKNGKAKGSLTITVAFEVSGDTITLGGKTKLSVPALPRRDSTFFVTSDGEITTEHPRQADMFPGPREITSRG